MLEIREALKDFVLDEMDPVLVQVQILEVVETSKCPIANLPDMIVVEKEGVKIFKSAEGTSRDVSDFVEPQISGTKNKQSNDCQQSN